LATSPVSTVDGTFTGNQYTGEWYCVLESSVPGALTKADDCRSKLLNLTCFTTPDCAETMAGKTQAAITLKAERILLFI